MNPQGSQIVNVEYFTSLTQQVNSASSCAELQALVTKAINSINATTAAITAQLALLAPMVALLSPPANPTAAVTWISNFITSYLTPQLASYTAYAAQQTALTAQIATLTAAINSKASEFTGCTISI